MAGERPRDASRPLILSSTEENKNRPTPLMRAGDFHFTFELASLQHLFCYLIQPQTDDLAR